MLKAIRTFAPILAVVGLLVGCGSTTAPDDGGVVAIDPPPPPPPALQVSMSPGAATVSVGNSADYAINVSGGAAGAMASWTCATSNSGIASVAGTASGCRATGMAVGGATITATVTKGSESTSVGAEITVTDDTPAFGPGTYLVGTEIQPGLYRSEGPITYFERLSGVSGELADIIANGALLSGPVVVEIMATDVAFHSQGTGTWTPVDGTYQPQLKNTFGDGVWIVGRDIEPGVYRTQDDITYYARLSGFGHTLDDIIVNAALVVGGAIIEISPTDAGFETSGEATWTKEP